MPIYEYKCSECGMFSALKKLSESSSLMTCVSCGEAAIKIVSIPHLALVSLSTRSAHERNEKASSEPRQARRSSCGCTGLHSCKPGSKENSSPVQLKKESGLLMQTKKTARPWMLGH